MHKETVNRIALRNHERFESTILNALNNIIKYKIYNNDLKKVCFTAVKLTKGNDIARIYVDCYDRSKIDEYIKQLNTFKAPFRKGIADVVNFKKTPDLLFVKDASIDNFVNIKQLLSKIK